MKLDTKQPALEENSLEMLLQLSTSPIMDTMECYLKNVYTQTIANKVALIQYKLFWIGDSGDHAPMLAHILSAVYKRCDIFSSNQTTLVDLFWEDFNEELVHGPQHLLTKLLNSELVSDQLEDSFRFLRALVGKKSRPVKYYKNVIQQLSQGNGSAGQSQLADIMKNWVNQLTNLEQAIGCREDREYGPGYDQNEMYATSYRQGNWPGQGIMNEGERRPFDMRQSEPAEWQQVEIQLKLVLHMICVDSISILDLSKIMVVEDRFQQEGYPPQVQITWFILMILDTFYYIQKNGRSSNFKFMTLILKAINAIFKNKHLRPILCFLLQNYEAMTSKGGLVSNYQEQNMSFQFSLFEFVYSLKDKPLEAEVQQQKWKLINQFLKLANNIFIYMEDPMEYFPDENALKIILENQSPESSNNELLSSISQLKSRYQGSKTQCLIDGSTRDLLMCVTFLVNNQQNHPSHFIKDMLFSIYNVILPVHDQIIFDRTYKFRILRNVFQLTGLIFQRLLVNPSRVPLYIRKAEVNPLVKIVTPIINQSPVFQVLLNSFDVIGGQSTNFINYLDTPLPFINKIWQQYQHESESDIIQGKQSTIKVLQNFLAQSFALMETVLSAVEVFSEFKMRRNEEENSIYKFNLQNVGLVQKMEEILLRRESMHHYENKIIKRGLDKSTHIEKINLIQAFAAHINFEQIYNLTDPFINEEFWQMDNSSEHQLQLQDLETYIDVLDQTQLRNYLVRPSLPNNQYDNSISARCIRCITKILIIWQKQPNMQKQSLVDYFDIPTQSNAISYSFGLSQYSPLMHNLSMSILKLFNQINQHPEQACAALDFIIVCINTQKSFTNYLLNEIYTNTINLENKISLCTILEQILERYLLQGGENGYNRVTNKIANLFLEVLLNANDYQKLSYDIRHNLLNSLTQKVLSDIRLSDQEDLRLVQISVSRHDKQMDMEIDPLPVAIPMIDQKQDFTMLKKIVNEKKIYDIVVKYNTLQTLVQMLTNEIFKKEALSNSLSESITNVLKRFKQDWLEAFKDIHTFDLLELISSQAKQLQEIFEEIMRQHKNMDMQTPIQPDIWLNESNARLVHHLALEPSNPRYALFAKDFYRILDVNTFGFGRNYMYDSNDFFHNMRQLGIRHSIVLGLLDLIQTQNYKKSVIESIMSAFQHITNFYTVAMSLGHKGFAHSTLVIQNQDCSSLLKAQLTSANKQELDLYNCNYQFKFSHGLFGMLGDQHDKIKRKNEAFSFCLEVTELLLASIYREISLCSGAVDDFSYLNNKVTIVSSSLAALRHMISHKVNKPQKKDAPNFTLYLNNIEEKFTQQNFFSCEQICEVYRHAVEKVGLNQSIDLGDIQIMLMNYLSLMEDVLQIISSEKQLQCQQKAGQCFEGQRLY